MSGISDYIYYTSLRPATVAQICDSNASTVRQGPTPSRLRMSVILTHHISEGREGDLFRRVIITLNNAGGPRTTHFVHGFRVRSGTVLYLSYRSQPTNVINRAISDNRGRRV